MFGVEAQGDWADISGSSASLFYNGGLVNQTKTDAIGLFTCQIDYARNNTLLYVTGGAAVTANTFSGVTGGVVLDQVSYNRRGGAAGAGIEVGFAPDWSVAAESDHLLMGKQNVIFNFVVGGFSRSDNIHQDVDMATIRLNYRFGGSVVARYVV